MSKMSTQFRKIYNYGMASLDGSGADEAYKTKRRI